MQLPVVVLCISSTLFTVNVLIYECVINRLLEISEVSQFAFFCFFLKQPSLWEWGMFMVNNKDYIKILKYKYGSDKWPWETQHTMHTQFSHVLEE